MVVIVFLLLVIDWLAFHDIFEPHSLRDGLTLLASVLVFAYFAREYSRK